jgi:two-component system chemotaxis response regulator CheB
MIVFCEDCGRRIDLTDPGGRTGTTIYICNSCNHSQDGAKYGNDCVACLPDAEKPAARTVRLLIVDDSNLIRKALRQALADDDRIRIVGEAPDGRRALELLPDVDPDVITLDINMPVMDGLTTLKHLMLKHPVPAVMLSTLTAEGATETFEALKLGAVDFMRKPSRLNGADFQRQNRQIADKIVLAAGVEMDQVQYLATLRQNLPPGSPPGRSARGVVAACAAEGGYRSLLQTVPHLTDRMESALVAVLYAEAAHIDAFAGYLDACSKIRVERARDGQPLQAGHCYLVSNSEYATVSEAGGGLRLMVNANPFPEKRGAGNMLMISLAGVLGAQAGGVVLSGLGEDGVEGMQEIHRVGGMTLVQSPASCLHREMPLGVISAGAVAEPAAGSDIAEAIARHAGVPNR